MDKFRKVEPLLSKINVYIGKKKQGTLNPLQISVAEHLIDEVESVGGIWTHYAESLRSNLHLDESKK